MFKSILPAAPVVAQPNGQPNPGNMPGTAPAAFTPASTPGTAPNGTVPGDTNVSTTIPSPLDTFSDMWKTDATSGNQAQPLFNIDQAKMMEAARQQDFTKLISQEQMQAVLAGGEGAMQAFTAVLNIVGQDVYARSAMATTKLIEGAVNKTNKTMTDSLPDMIKRHNVSNGLREDNPALNHPAAQPIVSALEAQMTMKYPNASAREIRNMVTDYMTNFAGLVNPPAASAQQVAATKAAAGTDWSTFL